MTEEEYLRDRLDKQLRWHADRAAVNQSRYKLLQLVVIVAGALVPLFTSVWDADSIYSKWVVGSLGVLITGITAAISLYKFQENWIQYRVTAEALKSEKFLFLTKAQPYNGAEPFKLLVLRVEEILAGQQEKWQTMIGPAGKNKTSDGS